MKMESPLTWCCVGLGLIFLLPTASLSENTYRDIPVGDPRRCFGVDGKSNNILRFEVIPGGGWDNLRNKDTGTVMKLNYSRCRTTDDGKFLIPDNVFTIPRKISKVVTYAELITHWNNYTSTLSRSINIHAGLHFFSASVSGKFSDEYQRVKARQHFDKSMTTRVQARYVLYTAMTEPSSVLNDAFRSRLRTIATYLTLNRTDLARYESQLLVRDYGTHVITSVDVGAALVEVDELSATYVRKYDSEKHTITASASASFFGIFDFGSDFSQTTTKTQIDEYRKERTSSQVMTIGGPAFRPKNFTVNNWTDAILNEMVALDRSGEPLFSIIRDSDLPDIPQSVTYDVINYVTEAVHLYYEHNTHRGCTNPDSPNFSFQANIDDDSCLPPRTNYTFGGVYQTCKVRNFLQSNMCKDLTQKNPLTGDFSCPDDYEPVPFQQDYAPVCRRCYLILTCCDIPDAPAFWCAAKRQVDANSGFLFGGLYTSTVANILTQQQNCPPEFYPLKLFNELSVCVSNDYELGYKYSLPFAGFFSCRAGNPLVLREKEEQLKSGGKPDLLTSFILQQGYEAYPKTCPKGYSQHLAIVQHSCSISFCVKAGSLSEQGLPVVQRPPFMKPPGQGYIIADNQNSMFDGNSKFWSNMKQMMLNFITEEHLDDQLYNVSPTYYDTDPTPRASKRLSGGGIAAISVFATLVCVLLGSIIVVTIRRRRRGQYRETDPWADRTEGERLNRQSNSVYTRMEDTPVVVSQT